MDEFDQVGLAKARYCRYIDTKQWDAFKSLLVPTPSLRIYGPEGQLQVSFNDREEFTAICQNFLAQARSVHQVHNEELSKVSDTEIHAIWSMEDYIVNLDGSEKLHGFGHYHEKWLRSEEGWRIASMDLRRTILKVTP